MSETSRLPVPGFRANGSVAGSHTAEKRPGCESSLQHLESLVRRSLEDPAFCGMTWHKFQARSVDQVAALRRALDAGNTLELAREAQTLKYVAESLAATTLGARADALELAALRGDLKQAARALGRACQEIDRCARAAGKLLGRPSSA